MVEESVSVAVVAPDVDDDAAAEERFGRSLGAACAAICIAKEKRLIRRYAASKDGLVEGVMLEPSCTAAASLQPLRASDGNHVWDCMAGVSTAAK